MHRPHLCPSTVYDRVSTTSLSFDRLQSCIDHIFVLRQTTIMHRPHLCPSTDYNHASTTSLSFDRLQSCIDYTFVLRQSMIVYRPYLCPVTEMNETPYWMWCLLTLRQHSRAFTVPHCETFYIMAPHRNRSIQSSPCIHTVCKVNSQLIEPFRNDSSGQVGFCTVICALSSDSRMAPTMYRPWKTTVNPDLSLRELGLE